MEDSEKIILNTRRVVSFLHADKRITFSVCMIYTVAFFIWNAQVNYGPDTYSAIASAMSPLLFFNTNGRLITGLYVLLLGKVSGSYTMFFRCSLCIAFCFALKAVYEYAILFTTVVKQERGGCLETWERVLYSLIACATVLNIFFVEYLLFMEQAMFVLAIAIDVKAVGYFLYFWKDRKKADIWKVMICLICVSFIYQTLVMAFIVLVLPFIMRDISKRNVIFQHLSLYVSCILGLCPQYVYTKFFIRSKRLTSDAMTVAEAAKIYAPVGETSGQFILQRITFGMWGYLVLCVAIGIYYMVLQIRQKGRWDILRVFYLAGVTCLCGISPYILKLTSSYTPRIYYPLGMMFGILVIYGVLRGWVSLDLRFAGVLFILLVIQWGSLMQVFTERYLTNYEDQYLSGLIQESIQEYEKENHVNVRFITFYEDSMKKKYINNTGWCLSQRAYSADWSRLPALNYYEKTDYQKGQIDAQMAEYYINQNWNIFSDNQINIIGDTAHICVY